MIKLLPKQFQDKIEIQEDGCWYWTGHINRGGYGQISWKCKPGKLVHRVIYELLVGPIPDGLELDHLCRVRHCVNPVHVESVTHKVNIKRSDVHNGSKIHCKHGHEFTKENTYRTKNGGRQCRTCGRETHKKGYDRKKQKV